MAEVLKKFGRYFLLDQIAQGGMAEIYRARLASTDGAGRLMVIKRIQAGFGNNSEFLKMFRAEIKVTMGFNHPNIAQLYDFGEEQAQPFIAMELVDGKNLRQFINRFNELKKSFPIELAVYIIEQAASGLHYAHNYKDKITGQHLSIVHRDVSPQNIIVSYEGGVKVIDFGIAKAANSEHTRAGVIKGKPSYLSPEQICGEQLDGRSDIFALGVVLWELLVGRKLFAGDNDLAVLKLIESSQTYVKPPSTYNRMVPQGLDNIVLKALSKQREKRYQTAEELQRALHRFLYTFTPDFNPTDLAYVAKDLFKSEIVDDRKKIQKLNEEVEKLLITSDLVMKQPTRSLDDPDGTLTDSSDEGTKHTHSLVPTKSTQSTGSRDAFESDFRTGTLEFDDSKIKPLPKPKERRPMKIENPAEVGHRGTLSATIPVTPKKKLPWAKITNAAVYVAAAVLLVAIVGPMAGIQVPGLTGLVGDAKDVNFSDLSPIHLTGKIPRIPSSGRSVVLHLDITPPGNSTTATINGVAVNMSNPAISVPEDAPLDLVVQNPDFRTVERQFVVDSAELGDRADYEMDVQMDPLHYGYLTLRSTPIADVTIMIDGKPWKKRTPFEKEKLPIGTYTIKLTNDLLEMERTLKVQIHEGEITEPFDPDREASREVKLNPERAPSSTK